MHKIHDACSMHGSFRIEWRDARNGRLLDEKTVNNLLMPINRDIRTQMLMGTYAGGTEAIHIKYFAFGTGSTAATPQDTQLESEQLRKQITQISNPEPGKVISVVSLGAGEANDFDIREIGVFCGANASSTANSGTMISRVVAQIDKNSNIIVNIIRTDTCII